MRSTKGFMTTHTIDSTVVEYRPSLYPAVETEVLTALENGAERVVLDLEALTALDTQGVRGLISLLRRVRAAGGELVLRAVQPGVRRTLQVTALDRIFQLIDAEAA
jgi:anti-sigma B factor antagonist